MDKIHLIENNELIKSDSKTAETLNNFFSNIVQNLNIARYTSEEPFIKNIQDPTLKAILKYRNHPSFTAIRGKYNISQCFKFTEVDQKEIEKEIKKLDVNKASQRSDIPTKITKENIDIFGHFIGKSYNNTIKASQFYQNLKLADITPAHKKGKKRYER